jgi:soluble lytic murein transglycosylase-like protein
MRRSLWASVWVLVTTTVHAADVVHLAHERCPKVGVLPQIALKVMRVESGCEPYAIGVQMQRLHRSYLNESPVVAASMLQAALRYTSNVGIGVMQVNWRAWGDRLGLDPADLLNPALNIQAGCEILSEALGGDGTLLERIGRYHSSTPHLRDAYGRRVIGATPCGD